MPSLDDYLDAAFDATPPRVTVHIKMFNNSPRATPFVLQLLTEQQEREVRKYVGTLASEEEKVGAWIGEPIAHALVAINGKPVTGTIAERRELVDLLTKPRLAALYEGYRDLDRAEMEAQAAIAQADPLAAGAASGPPSAPGAAGPSGDSPTRASPVPARAPSTA